MPTITSKELTILKIRGAITTVRSCLAFVNYEPLPI